MLFLPLYAFFASISIILTLTSDHLPFRLGISQRTFTLSSTVPNGHLTLDPEYDNEYLEALFTYYGWVQCSLAAYTLIS
jgi:hypothetical protein